MLGTLAPPGFAIMETRKVTLRVDLGSGRALGPGKIRLLELIEETGSISQAGRKLGMSYRRARLLVDDMNNCFCDPVIEARPGGAHGSGATLTAFGQMLVERYRAIEAGALVATRKHLSDIEMALKASAP
jgi:molybdate transport system regulatory protein